MKKIILLILSLSMICCTTVQADEDVVLDKNKMLFEQNISLLVELGDYCDLRIVAIDEYKQSKLFFITLSEAVEPNLLDGECVILAVDKNYRILDSIKTLALSSFNPYFSNDKYVGIVFRDSNTYLSEIILYDKSKRNLLKLPLADKFIAEVFIDGEYVFYSTERTNKTIKRVSIDDGNIYEFDIYLPNASFFKCNDELFLSFEDDIFQIVNDQIQKVESLDSYTIDTANNEIDFFSELRSRDYSKDNHKLLCPNENLPPE